MRRTTSTRPPPGQRVRKCCVPGTLAVSRDLPEGVELLTWKTYSCPWTSAPPSVREAGQSVLRGPCQLRHAAGLLKGC